MLSFRTTKQFEREYKQAVKQGKDIEKLHSIMHKLVNQEPLEGRFRDHPLIGNWKGYRDCHIGPDWLLIYRIDSEAKEIVFVRTGTHSDCSVNWNSLLNKMKSKTIHIEIRGLHETLREAGEVFEKVAHGNAVKKKNAIYFSNLKEMRRALTEKRLELLHTVKERRPSSVYELAKMLHRDLKNVLQNVEYLRELGVLEVGRPMIGRYPEWITTR
ncbi:MAG: hypothetical protein OHK006_23060 [Thermodesulfovibrionales bacterium]